MCPVWIPLDPGVLVDSRLMFRTYINYLIKKAFLKTDRFSRRLRPKPDYRTRLLIFVIEPSEFRRVLFDLFLCCKVVHGLSDLDFGKVFAYTAVQNRCPHRLQHYSKNVTRNHSFRSFSCRAVNFSGKLPSEIVEATRLAA